MDVMIALGSACLLIRVGQGLYGAGLVRSKNAAGAVLRAIGDLCVASLAFWVIGAAILMQPHNLLIGFDRRMIAFAGGSSELFFLMATILIGTWAVSGAAGERSRFFPLWSASILLAALVFPLGAKWTWHGWLRQMGFIDVAGGTWLHLSGAICAAIAALAVGPRTGKYHRDGSASMIPGHNVPLAGVGVLVMIVGWGPYLAGCLLQTNHRQAIGPAAIAALLSAAAAGTTAILLGYFRYGKPDVILTMLGVLGGLVAISAGAGQVGSRGAVLLGAVAGILVPLSAIWIDLLARIDDPAGAIAVHGVGGLWGTLAAGFLPRGAAVHRLHQTGVQLVGIVSIGLLALVLSAGLFGILRATIRIRVSEADEYDGLDLAEHDIGAYPDFQQTMIKSYHLREA